MKNPNHTSQQVRWLWRVKIRALSFQEDSRSVYDWYVAGQGLTSEKQVVALARSRFSPEWWEEHIYWEIDV